MRPMQDKIRILHITSRMKLGGGLPGWLFESLQHIDMDFYQVDFLSILDDTEYDDEKLLIPFGSRIYHCAAASKRIVAWSTFNKLKRIMQGNYDIVALHVPFYEYPLIVARVCSIPVRICHVHTDCRLYLKHARTGIFGRSLRYYKKFMVTHCSTHHVAVSKNAGLHYFGANWLQDANDRLLYCGVDLSLFSAAVDASEVRREFGLSEDCFIIGHVGRISILNKNSEFVIQVFAELLKRCPEARLLWVGDGEDAEQVRGMVRFAGLQDHVVFAGIRNDVARVMRVMDVFLLASISEGLGLVLVEAQASGIPCVFFDVIPKDADVVPELCYRVSRNESVRHWVETILAIRTSGVAVSRESALQQVMEAPFNIDYSMAVLTKFYKESVQGL